MKKFSNDKIENLAINALEPDKYGTLGGLRRFYGEERNLFYIPDAKIWRWEWHGAHPHECLMRYADWTDIGAKEEIIEFLIEAKPELEREFLRAKSKETLTAPRVLEAL